jgi:hypothetical protein
MKTFRRAFRLISAMQPIVGQPCNGIARAIGASSTPVKLCAGTIGFPILTTPGGSLAVDTALPVLTLADVDVTDAGVDVAFRSTWGSGLHNFPPGTPLRWYRPPAGVEARAVCAAGATGAVAGDVRRAVLYEAIGSGTVPRDLWLAKAGSLDTYPAIVVSWEGTQDYQRVGTARALRADRWAISLVVARNTEAALRAAEGLDLLDDIEEILLDREGSPLGTLSKPALEVLDRKRFAISDTSYVYQVNVATMGGVQRRDVREFPPWTRTLYDYTTTTAERRSPTDPDLEIVDGAVYPQTNPATGEPYPPPA